MSGNKGCGCGKVVAFGCAGLVIFAALAVVTVGLNFERIQGSEWFQDLESMAEEGKESFAEMMALRGEVLDEFPMEGCEVSRNRMHAGGSVTRTLVLTLVNPIVPAGEATEGYAERVARFAADRYAALQEVDQLQIVVQRKLGTGVSFSGSQSFRFPVSELSGGLPTDDPTEELPAEAPPAEEEGDAEGDAEAGAVGGAMAGGTI